MDRHEKIVITTLATAAVILTAQVGLAATFVPEVLDDSNGTSTRFVDIDVDTEGNAHVAFGSDGSVRIMSQIGEAWSSSTRNVGAGNRYCALDVDDTEVAHLVIRAGAYPESFLMYLTHDGGFWSTATPDGVGSPFDDSLTGDWPDIVVDTDGRPFISYRYQADIGIPDGDLRLAWRDGSTWTVETVDDGPDDVGEHTSIALGLAGRPRIAYYDRTEGNLMVARKTASDSWVLEVVDDGIDVGTWTDIAIDADNVPHVSYVDERFDAVRYATRVGGVWTTEEIPDVVPAAGEGTSIAVDAQGDVHIVFYNPEVGKLRRVVKSGGVWSADPVDETADRGWRPALALDGDGRPHIAYVEEPDQEIWYATTEVGVGVPGETPVLPSALRVYPNPASVGTPVRIELAAGQAKALAGGLASPASIRIYDLAGRQVRTLHTTLSPGDAASWDGRADDGRALAGGVYLVRVVGEGVAGSQRVVLVP
jgi:hypothetical protein